MRNYDFSGNRSEQRGKGDQFPLVNPKKRAKGPGQEKYERPLLLNPSKKDPERHLEFPRCRQRLGLVRPALTKRNRESEKGKHSILVYGLDRPNLIQARLAHSLRLRFVLFSLCQTCSYLEVSPNNIRQIRDLEKQVSALASSYLAERNIFLGMARQHIFPVTKALARRPKLKQFVPNSGPVLPFPDWRQC